MVLPNPADNSEWSLAVSSRSAKATVIAFLASGCPASTAYAPRLGELHKTYAEKGVNFVAVMSHASDESGDIQTFVKSTKLPFPALRDADRAVAKKLNVTRVPTAILLDAGRTVRYAGRIDDQFAPGVHKAKRATNELATAIDELLSEKEVTVKHAPAAGCLLPSEKAEKVPTTITYHSHIAAILQKKCQSCHRPGEVGPFSLTTYRQAKAWSDMIREVVTDGTMPPWHADAPKGHFVNDRRLGDADQKTLIAWIDGGCPEGDPTVAPPKPEFIDGWRLPRKPDQVIAMNREVKVPASFLGGLAGMPYQYITAGEPFPEDRWVEGFEVRPQFREAIHHIIAFVIPPGKRPEQALTDNHFGRLMLGAYVPGDQPAIYPTGTAKLIPQGSTLLFEMHYTPNGTAGVDRSSIGLIFAKEPPRYRAESLDITNHRFSIPPGAENHEVKSQKTFDRETIIVSVSPHMHVRGKAFQYELVTKNSDGTEKRETVCRVPKYDFNWQTTYTPAKPIIAPAGSRLECTAWFDKKRVRWGEQTWEEMMIGFIETVEKTDRNEPTPANRGKGG
jgi:thiol-disulfide isomerase/thioredoxin